MMESEEQEQEKEGNVKGWSASFIEVYVLETVADDAEKLGRQSLEGGRRGEKAGMSASVVVGTVPKMKYMQEFELKSGGNEIEREKNRRVG
jgi:hypothetical protein